MTDLSAFRDYINSLPACTHGVVTHSGYCWYCGGRVEQRVRVYDMPEQPAPAEPAADGWLSEHGIALAFIIGGVLWALLWWLD